ncbi:unnamed protein product [Pylaiella littoralis]
MVSSQVCRGVPQHHRIPKDGGAALLVDSTYLQQVGNAQLLQWKKQLAEERGRFRLALSKIQKRMASEQERQQYFRDLVGEIHAAKAVVRQREPNLEGRDGISPSVDGLMDSMAERLNATGPQPLSLLREAEQQMARVEEQDVGLVQEILERNRVGVAKELSQTQQMVPSANVQQLRARQRMSAQTQLMEDLMIFVNHRTASVVAILGRG